MDKMKVYFNGSFRGHHGRDHAGKEIQINQTFDWAGHRWFIPAAYSCGKGLVIDFCMQAAPEAIQNFIKKWNLSPENDSCTFFTEEQQMQMELENPLCLHFTPYIEVNRKTLSCSHSCSVCLNPCLPDKNSQDSEAVRLADCYGLDPSSGWVICRNAFPWSGSRRPEVKTLSLTMEQQPVQIPGPHFRIHSPGDSFTFLSPVSNTLHRLTVNGLESQTLPESAFRSDHFTQFLYPRHCTVMSYSLSPEPADPITVFDCDKGDKPKKIGTDNSSFHPLASNICCIGIISGTDGSDSAVLETERQKQLHTVCSALHFEPAQSDTEWRIVFNAQPFDKASFLLIYKI